LDITFDPDGAGPVSDKITDLTGDDSNHNPPGLTDPAPDPQEAYYINYRFTAVAGENLVITLDPYDGEHTYHLYGLTNEVVPEPSTCVLAGLGLLGLLCYSRRRNRGG
jgi:hypothetical protein